MPMAHLNFDLKFSFNFSLSAHQLWVVLRPADTLCSQTNAKKPMNERRKQLEKKIQMATLQKLLVEFKKSVKNAPQKIFIAFSFHLCQSFVGKINEVGLKPVYKQNRAIIKFPKENCCRYVPGEAEARKIVVDMKETSRYTGNTNAIATSLASVSENLCVQLSMPKKTLITRTLNRHRQKNNMNDLPVLPHTKKFEVPEDFKDFLIYDSGTEDPEDDTSINGYNPPCIYALLPNKREKTYERLLIAVKEKIPNSRPTRILVDFEKAVMNAFQKSFTDATLSGCYFHLCQSFVRKINEVGLKSVYEQNPGLALSLRMVPALAFLPLEEVEPAFDLVVEKITGEVELLSLEEDVLEKIDLLASYFQKTYLGHNIGSTHRPPVFQPVI